jgi:hypothetical protein
VKRILLASIAIALLTGVIAACSGSSGAHTQSLSPTAPGSDFSSSSASTTSPPDSSSPTTKPSASWTHPVYGQAQPAVDAYLSWVAAADAGLADPANFNAATASKFSAGEAEKVLVGSITDEKRRGRAWRGVPWPSRVLVTSTNFHSAAPEVMLSDCPAVNNSWVEYVVATGKPVPRGPKPKVPPPYAATIKVFKVAGSKWLVTSYEVDGSKTCTR